MATTKIRSSSITDGQVANADLSAAVAVTGGQIADDAVTLAKMAGLARGKIIVGDASGDPSALTVGAVNQVLKSDGTDVSWGADSGGLFSSYSILTDEKTASTAGGTFTSGAWRTRDLQNEVYDGIGITFSTNEFILPTGNYLIQWSAPAYSVNLHQSRLYDVTGTAIIEYGSTAMATSLLGHYADVGFTRSFGSARVTPSGTNNYKIEHHCEDTYASEGFGHAGGFAVEVYTVVEIFKES